MKKFILLTVFIAAGIISVSQAQNVMTVKLKNGVIHEFKVEDVSEVTFGSSEINPNYPIAEAIDLGLPSGTKWASWNVGASKPEEYGGYYAWGETEEKSFYFWSTYTHCDGTQETCHHIGDDIAGTQYDVAHVKWGGSWRMPTRAQQEELRLNCFGKWTQLNGVNGTLVTGPNGNSIFLPAAGCRIDDYYENEGEYGAFWSSSLIRDESHAHILGQDYKHWSVGDFGRKCGLSVRPVCK